MSTRLLYIIGLIVLMIAVYAYRVQHKPLMASPSIKDGLAFSAHQIGLKQVSEQGNLTLLANAEILSSKVGSDRYDLEGLDAVMYGDEPGTQTAMQAPSAIYDQTSGELELVGRVSVQHEEKKGSSPLSGGLTRLETNNMTANTLTNTINSDSTVDVTLPAGALRVKSLSADLNSGIYQFNDISANYRP